MKQAFTEQKRKAGDIYREASLNAKDINSQSIKMSLNELSLANFEFNHCKDQMIKNQMLIIDGMDFKPQIDYY